MADSLFARIERIVATVSNNALRWTADEREPRGGWRYQAEARVGHYVHQRCVSDFDRLRAAVGRLGSREAFLYAFDLLEINAPTYGGTLGKCVGLH